MTFEDEVEIRRASVGTKVLAFGFAILAVLGSFWSVVWFIRSYVEQPRVNIAPNAAYAAQENPPAPPSAPAAAPSVAVVPQIAVAPPANPPAVIAAAPMAAADVKLAAPTPVVPAPTPVVTELLRSAPAAASPSSTGSVSDRWAAIPPTAPASPTAPSPAATTPSAPAAAAAPASPPSPAASTVAVNPPVNEVAETLVPAIADPAPLPRRKPTQIAAASREPPLPRPRPDGPAPQSIWQAVPTTDDRYQATQ